MYKDVIQSLDSGLLPIIGLIAFVVAFTLIVVWAFTMKKEDRSAAKQLPLDDANEISLSTNNTYAN